MTGDPKEIAATYFRSWKDKDFDTFRSILADDVTFAGPLGTANGPAECERGVRGLSEIVTDIDVVRVFEAGADVLTWFELHTSVAEPIPVVNWSHVENGKITRIRVTFDPRPLLANG
jgi:hypothetical protein